MQTTESTFDGPIYTTEQLILKLQVPANTNDLKKCRAVTGATRRLCLICDMMNDNHALPAINKIM